MFKTYTCHLEYISCICAGHAALSLSYVYGSHVLLHIRPKSYTKILTANITPVNAAVAFPVVAKT
jgi:hypothetical protein